MQRPKYSNKEQILLHKKLTCQKIQQTTMLDEIERYCIIHTSSTVTTINVGRKMDRINKDAWHAAIGFPREKFKAEIFLGSSSSSSMKKYRDLAKSVLHVPK